MSSQRAVVLWPADDNDGPRGANTCTSDGRTPARHMSMTVNKSTFPENMPAYRIVTDCNNLRRGARPLIYMEHEQAVYEVDFVERDEGLHGRRYYHIKLVLQENPVQHGRETGGVVPREADIVERLTALEKKMPIQPSEGDAPGGVPVPALDQQLAGFETHEGGGTIKA